MSRWTLLLGLALSLTACKKGGDTTSDDTETTDDSGTDDTQSQEGQITGEIEFPVKPPVGPLIIVAASAPEVFANVVSKEVVPVPSFPDNQPFTLSLEPGDYYVGAWVDAGSDSDAAPGDGDPRGVALEAGSPVMVTVTADQTATVPNIKLRQDGTDAE